MNDADNALDYILFSARHVRNGDISRAFLSVCMDIRFLVHHDSFCYLREAVVLKTNDQSLQMSQIYRQIADTFASATDDRQVEVAIRSCIQESWKNRDEKFWNLFFPIELMKSGRPTNKVFVSRMACYLELWRNCKEVSYAVE